MGEFTDTRVCGCGRVHNYKHILQRCTHPVKSMQLTYYTAMYSLCNMLTELTSKRRKYMSDMLKLCTHRNYFSSHPAMNTIFATNQGITCHLI